MQIISYIALGLVLLSQFQICCAASDTSSDGPIETEISCWKIQAPASIPYPPESDIILSGKNEECPLTISISLPGSATGFMPGKEIEIHWNIKLEENRLERNAISFSSFPSKTIFQSNLRSCSMSDDTLCSPFSAGQIQTQETTMQNSTFSEDFTADFTSTELVFEKTGEVNLMVHVILPGDLEIERYDFVMYKSIRIIDDSNSNSGSNIVAPGRLASAGPVSSSTIIGIICGCVVVLMIIFYIIIKRKRPNYKDLYPAPTISYSREPQPRSSFDLKHANFDETFDFQTNHSTLTAYLPANNRELSTNISTDRSGERRQANNPGRKQQYRTDLLSRSSSYSQFTDNRDGTIDMGNARYSEFSYMDTNGSTIHTTKTIM